MSWVCNSHGLTRHDGFISYRAATEDGVAELLQSRLQENNITIFLDKRCLNYGEDWQIGFLEGLQNSTYLFYLISERSLQIMVEKLENRVGLSACISL
jgi:TIR domain